jgi:uncharacterized surface protein with fasciclin (FAS1) repeats
MVTRAVPVLALAALAVGILAPAAVAQEPVPVPVPLQPPETVIEALEAEGNYTQFLAAIRAADLEETLRGEGPFTVFAPTDEAFEDLPEGQWDALMADTEALRDLLSFHIVPQEIRSEEVIEARNVATLQGSDVEIVRDGDELILRAAEPAEERSPVEEPIPPVQEPIPPVEGLPIPPVEAEPMPAPAEVSATVQDSEIVAMNGVIHSIDSVLLIDL